MFILALNFCLTDSDEVSYDVPSLAIGLLFALPFVRDVQPNVPVVGATIDIFGALVRLVRWCNGATDAAAVACFSTPRFRSMRVPLTPCRSDAYRAKSLI